LKTFNKVKIPVYFVGVIKRVWQFFPSSVQISDFEDRYGNNESVKVKQNQERLFRRYHALKTATYALG
jgi:hypothetical protein